MAAELEILLVDHVELRGHHFGVGDALGVGAFYEVLDGVGNLSAEFVDYLVVLDIDDGGEGSHEGYLADFLLGEVFVLDFYDALFAQFTAVEVVADKDFVFIFLQAQNADDLINALGRDVVDDGAVLDGADHHFFFIFHWFIFFVL